MDDASMTPQRWENTGKYIRELFAREDPHLAGIMARATAAGMPAIDAGPESGRLLQMLTMLSGGVLAIEVGTLAGSSAIWISRGLGAGGRLISIDLDPKHIDFARRELASARDADGRGSAADRVTLMQGRGGEMLRKLANEFSPGSVDLIFLDAERSEYIPMLPQVKTLLHPGGVLAIDNALSAKRWVADPYAPGEPADIMDTVNRAVAADKGFAASTLLPVGNGLLVAIRA